MFRRPAEDQIYYILLHYIQPGNSRAVSPDNLIFVKYEYGMDQHDQPTRIDGSTLRISKNHQLMLPKFGQYHFKEY